MNKAVIVFILAVAFLAIAHRIVAFLPNDKKGPKFSSPQKTNFNPSPTRGHQKEEISQIKTSIFKGTGEETRNLARTLQKTTGTPLSQKVTSPLIEKKTSKVNPNSVALLDNLKKMEKPFGGNSLRFFISQKIRKTLSGENLSREQYKTIHQILTDHYQKSHQINLKAIDPNISPGEVLAEYSELYNESSNQLQLEVDYLLADSLLNKGETSFEESSRRLRNSMGNITNFSDEQNLALERSIHRVLLENPDISFTSRGHQGGLSINPLSTEEEILNSREFLKDVSSYAELARKSYETISDGKESLLIALREEGLFSDNLLNGLDKEFKSQRKYLEGLANNMDKKES